MHYTHRGRYPTAAREAARCCGHDDWAQIRSPGSPPRRAPHCRTVASTLGDQSGAIRRGGSRRAGAIPRRMSLRPVPAAVSRRRQGALFAASTHVPVQPSAPTRLTASARPTASAGDFPGALQAFPSLAHRRRGRAGDRARPARGGAAHLPDPLRAQRAAASAERRAAEVRDALRSPQLEVPAVVSRAFAASTRAAVGLISEINRRIKELEAELAASFEQHPDADIYRSLPGLGVVLGARVLGEFGDDPERYASAKSRRNYAGTSPLTVRRRRPVGAVLAASEPGLPRLLRPPARRRRPPPPGVARPRQPPRRLPARLSQNPLPLRRVHRLGSPFQPRGPRCLTP